MHTDALEPGERVLVVDDVLATGGTARATAQLIEGAGAVVHGLAMLLELSFLPGPGCCRRPPPHGPAHGLGVSGRTARLDWSTIV